MINLLSNILSVYQLDVRHCKLTVAHPAAGGGGHLFYDLFLHGRGGAGGSWPPCSPPFVPLLTQYLSFNQNTLFQSGTTFYKSDAKDYEFSITINVSSNYNIMHYTC